MASNPTTTSPSSANIPTATVVDSKQTTSPDNKPPVTTNKNKSSFLQKINLFIGKITTPGGSKLKSALETITKSYKNGKFYQVSSGQSTNKILSPAKAKDQLLTAQSIAEKLYQATSDSTTKQIYKDIDDYLLGFAKKYQKQMKKNQNTPTRSSINAHFQKLKKNDQGHKNNAMNSILKTLVAAIGKDSPGAMKARADLQRLLKKYPNKVPTALIQIVKQKLKKNGLGIILAIQLSATMLGLLISIIPIPGLAIIGEGIAIAANAGTDFLVAVGPEQIIQLLQNGSKKALEAFTKSIVPIIEGVSGAFCCNSSGSKKNMEKFGKIMQHLIELENIPDKDQAKRKINKYIKEIQGVMKKPVPGVDMAALDKLIKKYPPPKGKGSKKKRKKAGGGKRRTQRKKRRSRRKKRKTNKYRNKFTRRY